MRPTGRRSSTDPAPRPGGLLEGGWRWLSPAVFALLLLMPGRLPALDLFTLWRQPMIPVQMIVGGWTDYRTVALAGGRRSEDLLRVQCVGRVGSSPQAAWVVEMLPLVEAGGRLEPVPGEGLLLEVSPRLLRKQGALTEIITRVVRWREGRATELPAAEWREDPLVAASLKAEFQPQTSVLTGSSSRVVGGRELLCDQFQMAAAETLRVDLPRGTMEQISLWEVTAAVSADVPFLGIAYAAERTRSETHLDPPSKRVSPPPPATRVETMELIAFGNGAVAHLTGR